MINDNAKNLLALLNSLPPAPSVTFRGHIDTSVTKPRAIVSPTLTATSHSIAIATNNLARPQVAVFVGANGRDLSPIMAGAPGCNLQEVTYLPGTYFLQHTCQEFSGITIQVFEEMQLASGGDALRQHAASIRGIRSSSSLNPHCAPPAPTASLCPRGPRIDF